jgi:uncharacterized protein (UPF0276 family)
MTRAIQGVGIGLRLDYAEELLKTQRQVDFIEVVPENWVRFGGKRRRLLEAAAERWPAVPHSVSLSIGGEDPLDEGFVEAVGGLCCQLRAPFYSDHLCYSAVNGGQLHDLLPLPFTQEVVEHVVRRVGQVQDRLEVPLVLENATFYAHMPGAQMDEAEFLCRVLEGADCGMLLDVNNVYVNGRNHGFDPVAFVDRLPLQRVRQIHLAGHTVEDEAIIDTHIGPIIDPVWDLYRHTLARAGRMIPTLIEWDQEIPPVDGVLDEVDRAREHAARALT